MIKKIVEILVCIIFITNSTFFVTPALTEEMPQSKGWIEEQHGFTILHVSGSYYEMGYQHGTLLKDEILENMRGFTELNDQFGWTYDKVKEVWSIQQQYLPDVYKQEMQGMADAVGVNYERIGVHNTWIGVFNHLHSCWGAALWGDATSSGELLHMRSADGANMIKDPITGTLACENQVLIIREPDNASASMAPIFSGDIMAIGGFNEHGITVSELSNIGKDTTFHGINAGYRMRMVLDFAKTGEDAVHIMNSNRTCCWNFIVSDANIPTGYAIEQSANFAFANTWFDPVESTDPFWQIKDVVRRGNCFINPILANMQREHHDPSGLKGYLRMILGKDLTYGVWIQYKAISDEIEKEYGTLTAERALSLLQNVYLGNTNIFFKLTLSQHTYTSRQWVSSPATGDMVLCYSIAGEEAYLNPGYTFNFYELLHATPP